jgi:hypothetical protein
MINTSQLISLTKLAWRTDGQDKQKKVFNAKKGKGRKGRKEDSVN